MNSSELVFALNRTIKEGYPAFCITDYCEYIIHATQKREENTGKQCLKKTKDEMDHFKIGP